MKKEHYQCFSEEVKEKSISQFKSNKNDNETTRVKILTLQKNKEHSVFADKILSPLKRDKLPIEDLKIKRFSKSGF